MMRSMNAAVASLSAHQTKMDVIGNNIANVNTVGFKKSNVTFKESFSQVIQGASGPGDGRGGTNPVQIGFGADVGSIGTVMTSGAPEATGNPSDVLINGDGFFVVSNDPNNRNKFYTRAGNMALDAAGNLVTREGMRVMGYQADENGNVGSTLGGIVVDKSIVYPPQATKPSDDNPEEEVVSWAGNLDATTTPRKEILDSAGNPVVDGGFIGNTAGSTYIYKKQSTTSATDKLTYVPNEQGDASSCVSQSKDFKIYDDFGNEHTIKMVFYKDEVNQTIPNSTWKVHAFYMDDDGNMLPNGADGVDRSGAAPEPNYSTDGFGYITDSGAIPNDINGDDGFKLTFNEDGQIDSALSTNGGVMKLRLGTAMTNGASALENVNISFKDLNQFAEKSNVNADEVKGYPQGSLKGYSISETGEVVGEFDNDQKRVLGQVALAKFSNPEGLQKSNGNLYDETRNSGIPQIAAPGTNGYGTLQTGFLERSNVDIAQEFTSMITTQRGFQANSRVITTTDQMLEELVNLKR